jgi:hypothetical protein
MTQEEMVVVPPFRTTFAERSYTAYVTEFSTTLSRVIKICSCFVEPVGELITTAASVLLKLESRT